MDANNRLLTFCVVNNSTTKGESVNFTTQNDLHGLADLLSLFYALCVSVSVICEYLHCALFEVLADCILLGVDF